MEFVSGGDLKSRLAQMGRFSEDEGLRIARDVARALAHAHGEGVLHRDIKTANILLSSSGRVKLSDFGIASPRLALAALNPHAGESGAIGLEEIEILAPAVAILRGEGIAISDPKPADTLFHDAARASYDAVLCLYHDQALIPVKTLDFWGGVNTTLGLPVIRTSPDHGTGFDIAGKGLARADSLIAAIRLAGTMARARASGTAPG